MPTTIYVAGNDLSAGALDRSETSFLPLGGMLEHGPTETHRQLKVRASYTWRNLGARVTQNNLDDTSQLTARLNGADETALQLQIGAGSTGWFEDTDGTVALVDADLINYEATTATGGHGDTMTVTAMESELQHATLERPIAITTDRFDQGNVAQGTTGFFAIVGAENDAGVEASNPYTLRQDVTFSNMTTFVSGNDVDNDSTFDFREDGVSSTNLTITISAGSTGLFEDTDSEAVSTGSTVNYRVVAGAGMGGDSLQFKYVFTLQEGSVTGRNLGSSETFPTAYAVNTTNYLTLEGATDATLSTELDAQVEAAAGVDVTDLFIRVSANSLTTADTTITMRLNGADSALDVTISAGSTGIFEDADTVEIAVNDLINWELAVASGGSGTISVVIIGLEQGPGGVRQPFEDSGAAAMIDREVVVRAY